MRASSTRLAAILHAQQRTQQRSGEPIVTQAAEPITTESGDQIVTEKS